MTATRGPVSKVLILSDTHGHIDPRVLALAADCERVVHAGDIVGAGVLDALTRRCPEVAAVRGNNDTPAKWPAGEAARLAALPEVLELELPGGVLAVVHGHRQWSARDRHARLRALFPAARAVVYGHSHRQVCDLGADPWVLNPGAAGRDRTFGGPACLVLHAGPGAWRVVPHRFAPLARRQGGRRVAS